MKLHAYLDSTYLKTPVRSGLSEKETLKKVKDHIGEAISYGFKLVMIRPNYVSLAREMMDSVGSEVLVGTVIGFPEGTYSTEKKKKEALRAIEDGADELDFVVNYTAFKQGDTELVKDELLQGTQLALAHDKSIKWIIETAALNDKEIVKITALIQELVLENFSEEDFARVFIKSSTGFYRTAAGVPAGATVQNIKLMLKFGAPLPIKAAGGIRNYRKAYEMIQLGVKRIGTSLARTIVEGESWDTEVFGSEDAY